MRRKEREVAEAGRMDAIIRACDCLRLGFADGGAPYIVPMNFGYARKEGVPTFYFHCAREGRKLDLLSACPRVGFELDTGHHLQVHEEACGFTFHYQSVIGSGDIALVEDAAEKREALQQIMAQCTGRADWTFPDPAVERVAVLRLRVAEMTGKESG